MMPASGASIGGGEGEGGGGGGSVLVVRGPLQTITLEDSGETKLS